MPLRTRTSWWGVTLDAPDALELARFYADLLGWELFRLMLDVASGRRQTWAERWKLHNALVLFNPAPVT